MILAPCGECERMIIRDPRTMAEEQSHGMWVVCDTCAVATGIFSTATARWKTRRQRRNPGRIALRTKAYGQPVDSWSTDYE